MFFGDEVRKVQFGKRAPGPANRDEIISAQRKESQRRDLEKRKFLAACTVQKIFRGCAARRRTAEGLLAAADRLGEGDDRKLFIFSLVQKMHRSAGQAIAARIARIRPGDIADRKFLEIFLRLRVAAGLEVPESGQFTAEQFPIIREFLVSAKLPWTALPGADILGYMQAIPEICPELFAHVPGVVGLLPESTLLRLAESPEIFRSPFNSVHLANLGDLAKFAMARNLTSVDRKFLEAEILMENAGLEISREFPGFTLSAWKGGAGDARNLVALVSLVPAYERKLSEIYSGWVNKVAENILEERSDFRSRLVEVFMTLLSLNMRILYKRELADRKWSPLAIDRLRFWGLVANQVAARALLRRLPPSEGALALARTSYERRRALEISDHEWLVPGDFVEPDYEALGEFLASDAGEAPKDSVVGEFLKKLPHALGFELRVKIFRGLLETGALGRGRRAVIRRNHLFADGLKIFSDPVWGKSKVSVTFVNESDREEAGGGPGVNREFMHLWMKSAVEKDVGLFRELQNLRVLPVAFVDRPEEMAAVGRAVGNTLHRQLLPESRFSEIFLNRVLGRPFSVDELEELDEQIFRSIFRIKEAENVETWGLTFVVPAPDGSEIPLIPNGANVQVTDANKMQYIHLFARYKTVTEIAKAANQFSYGLNSVVPLPFLRFFTSIEVERLISGDDRQGFDVFDLRQNCVYQGYNYETSETLQHFWKLVDEEMSAADRVALLTFVTSTPRAPLLGFKALDPKFGIQLVKDKQALPTAATCMNLLKLPDYRDYATLKAKLMLAIHAKAGFDFS